MSSWPTSSAGMPAASFCSGSADLVGRRLLFSDFSNALLVVALPVCCSLHVPFCRGYSWHEFSGSSGLASALQPPPHPSRARRPAAGQIRCACCGGGGQGHLRARRARQARRGGNGYALLRTHNQPVSESWGWGALVGERGGRWGASGTQAGGIRTRSDQKAWLRKVGEGKNRRRTRGKEGEIIVGPGVLVYVCGGSVSGVIHLMRKARES